MPPSLVTMKLDGLKEVSASLAEFSKATSRAIVTRTLKQAVEPIRQTAKRLAPVRTGKLRDSIETVVLRSNAGKRAYAEAMSGGSTAGEAASAARAANRAAAGKGLEVTVRVAATSPHAHLVEFGTVDTPAHPFMRPALQSERVGTVHDITNIMKGEISKAARRAAARSKKG